MHGNRVATHKATAYLFFIAILCDLSAIVVVLVAIVLGSLPNHGSNACTCRTRDEGTFYAPTEDRTERCPCGAADERSLARPNATLVIAVVVVMVVAAVPAVVSATDTALSAVIKALIVIVIVAVLSKSWKSYAWSRAGEKRDCQQQCKSFRHSLPSAL
jgi:type III secretory pathway component EscS